MRGKEGVESKGSVWGREGGRDGLTLTSCSEEGGGRPGRMGGRETTGRKQRHNIVLHWRKKVLQEYQ